MDSPKQKSEIITRPTQKKIKFALIQLGSPADPSVSSVRSFLKEFLGDPRVVDLPRILWLPILHLFVLPFRPKRSARAYSRIWEGDTFPLVRHTFELVEGVRRNLQSGHEVNACFILGNPRVGELLDEWERDWDRGEAADELWVVPLFPQYSESTTASGLDNLYGQLKTRIRLPHLHFLGHFHRSKAFIDGSTRKIVESLKDSAWEELVISFHGIPSRRVLEKKDPYYADCYETFLLLKKSLGPKFADKMKMSFQSRFGSEKWLGPYTDEVIKESLKNGNKKIAVYCPSFVADCLETIDEIGHELAIEAEERGGEIILVPCLNSDEQWCKDFADYLQALSKGERIEYTVSSEEMMSIPEQKTESTPLSPRAKSTLKIIFLTLFIDLIGFSIIFPLFPELAAHYLKVDSDNLFLQKIVGLTQLWANTSNFQDFRSLVIFGGILGAIYSFLQFLTAPLWGSLSDRIGRRPVLLISMTGLLLSYVLWIFSGSFTMLILARFIGGVMGGNISTATAVVADVTEDSNRAKGMATIGIAFAMGFIFGPAIGGMLSKIKLTEYFINGESWGLNPFSAPAVFASLLTLFNLINIYRSFQETLPPEKKGAQGSLRTANVIALFRPLPYPGVNLTNIGHFLFLTAFSGMEFTLTFLAAERLGYTSLDNAYMFVFIGVLIALVQGGYVRRKAHSVGEKAMALRGIISILPGLILVAFAQSTLLLYMGLFFLAAGSSMAIPCLTSLVSLYTPANEQGKSLGVFRSLGALARVVGPIFASICYWRFGSASTYFIGSVIILLPMILISKLPPLKQAY